MMQIATVLVFGPALSFLKKFARLQMARSLRGSKSAMCLLTLIIIVQFIEIKFDLIEIEIELDASLFLDDAKAQPLNYQKHRLFQGTVVPE